jgi:hypothetical protein
MPEESPIRNVSHQKFHHDRELVDCLVEAGCSRRWRSTTNGLLQVRVCCGIVELYSSDAAEEIMVAGMLRVTGRCREGGLENELVGLVVKVVVEVVTEQTVDERGLRLVVVAKGRSSLRCQEQPGRVSAR